nr:hypothetical protein CFP56_34957 [Quercus suber]
MRSSTQLCEYAFRSSVPGQLKFEAVSWLRVHHLKLGHCCQHAVLVHDIRFIDKLARMRGASMQIPRHGRVGLVAKKDLLIDFQKDQVWPTIPLNNNPASLIFLNHPANVQNFITMLVHELVLIFLSAAFCRAGTIPTSTEVNRLASPVKRATSPFESDEAANLKKCILYGQPTDAKYPNRETIYELIVPPQSSDNISQQQCSDVCGKKIAADIAAGDAPAI